MIVLAIVATIAALAWSGLTLFANGMRDGPGEFRGGGLLVAVWCGVALLWLAWWVG